MINVATLSEDFPLFVTEELYEAMRTKKSGGWSNCDTQEEWLIKLHYIRRGFKEGRVSKEDFFRRETELVLRWWAKSIH